MRIKKIVSLFMIIVGIGLGLFIKIGKQDSQKYLAPNNFYVGALLPCALAQTPEQAHGHEIAKIGKPMPLMVKADVGCDPLNGEGFWQTYAYGYWPSRGYGYWPLEIQGETKDLNYDGIMVTGPIPDTDKSGTFPFIEIENYKDRGQQYGYLPFYGYGYRPSYGYGYWPLGTSADQHYQSWPRHKDDKPPECDKNGDNYAPLYAQGFFEGYGEGFFSVNPRPKATDIFPKYRKTEFIPKSGEKLEVAPKSRSHKR